MFQFSQEFEITSYSSLSGARNYSSLFFSRQFFNGSPVSHQSEPYQLGISSWPSPSSTTVGGIHECRSTDKRLGNLPSENFWQTEKPRNTLLRVCDNFKTCLSKQINSCYDFLVPTIPGQETLTVSRGKNVYSQRKMSAYSQR